MEIKNYKKTDEKHILELFKNSFGKSMSLEYWKWRFLQNPFDTSTYISLMWDNQLLVGHYAVSPVQMVFERKLQKTCLSMTTMTHSNYFGRGIFSQLSENLYAKLKSEDFEMVWGFPNNNSHYGFKKNLNWKDINIIPMMNISKEKVDKLKTKVTYLKHAIIGDVIQKSLNLIDARIRINKTKAYLNWRYVNNPIADYKIISLEGYVNSVVIYKKIPSFSKLNTFEIDIMELYFCDDLDVLKKLIYAISLEEKEDIIKFNLWKNIYDYNQIFFEKIGFIYSQPLTYLGYRSFTNNLLPENMKNWDISLGYSDVY
jgi:hypothetical protein